MSEPPVCLDCPFFVMQDAAGVYFGDPGGYCHSAPPTTLADSTGVIESHWPWVRSDDFCGSHPEMKEDNGS